MSVWRNSGKEKCAICLTAWLLLSVSSALAELVYPFGTTNADEMASFDVQPGRTYRLDYSWREIDVSRRSYLIPRLTVLDDKGKALLSRYVGMIQQRVFDPVDRSVQKWEVYAVVAEPGKPHSPANFITQSSVTLPANAARMVMAVVRHGEKAVIGDLALTATPVDPPARIRCKFPPLPTLAGLTDRQLDVALSNRVRSVATLKSEGDRTECYVDGRRVMPKIYKNCPWDTPQRYRAAKVFGDAGFNIFTLGFSLSDCWKADGAVDVSAVRTQLRKLLKQNPETFVFLELGVTPRPNWGEENPDEVFRCEAGKYALFTHGRVVAFTDRPKDDPKRNAYAIPSYLSEKYANEASAVIEKVFRVIESWPESKAVIGVYVNGGTDGQWLDLHDNSALPRHEYADYSVVSQRGFDAFRAARGEKPAPVPTTASLHRTDRVDFGEHVASVESEWYAYYTETVAKMRLKFAAAVKRATGRRILVGGYSPNTGLAGSPLIAQMCDRFLFQSPDIDFFAVVPSYVREYFDPVVSAVYNGSLAANGKLFVSELDLRSGDVGNWGFWGSDFWKTNHTAKTFRNKVLHYACHSLTRGGTYHAYDMDGGWFNTPAAQETWRIANRIADRARPMKPTQDRIAVVAGERFMFNRSRGHGHMLAYALKEMPRIALSVSGVPYDFYLVDDLLAKDPVSTQAALPKIILFTDASTVTYAEYQELRRRYAKKGRVLVWCGRPGVYATDGAKIDAELGMVERTKGPSGWIVADGKSDDPLMRGVDGLFSAWYPYYADGIIFPSLWSPTGWKTLASPVGTDLPGVSVRRLNGLTEVYLANPGQLHDAFLRNLAREAGFEPLLETGDISGCGSGLFYILSQKEGEKRFRLPAGVEAGETLCGPAWRKAESGYAVSLGRDEIFILEVKEKSGK